MEKNACASKEVCVATINNKEYEKEKKNLEMKLMQVELEFEKKHKAAQDTFSTEILDLQRLISSLKASTAKLEEANRKKEQEMNTMAASMEKMEKEKIAEILAGTTYCLE